MFCRPCVDMTLGMRIALELFNQGLAIINNHILLQGAGPIMLLPPSQTTLAEQAIKIINHGGGKVISQNVSTAAKCWTFCKEH